MYTGIQTKVSHSLSRSLSLSLSLSLSGTPGCPLNLCRQKLHLYHEQSWYWRGMRHCWMTATAEPPRRYRPTATRTTDYCCTRLIWFNATYKWLWLSYCVHRNCFCFFVFYLHNATLWHHHVCLRGPKGSLWKQLRIMEHDNGVHQFLLLFPATDAG